MRDGSSRSVCDAVSRFSLRQAASRRGRATRKSLCPQGLGVVVFVGLLRTARSQSATASWMAKSAETLENVTEKK